MQGSPQTYPRFYEYGCFADASVPPSPPPLSIHLEAHKEHTDSWLLEVFSGRGEHICSYAQRRNTGDVEQLQVVKDVSNLKNWEREDL